MSRSIRILCALAVIATALAFGQSAQAQTAYGVSSAGQLFRFNIASPGTVTNVGDIGFVPEGIDFRPGTQTLYALEVGAETSQLYRVNVVTGEVVAIGSGFPTEVAGEPSGNYSLLDTTIGFDFNPRTLQADGSVRIRVVASNGTNLRLNSDTGLVAAVDTPLAYAAGDPNVGTAPQVDAAAYINSANATPAAAGTTTLYVMDFGTDDLATQSPPNAGTLNTVGPFGAGVDALSGIGFDILSDPASTDDTIAGDTGYAVLRREETAGGSYLVYNVNLATGQITGGALVGDIADFTGGFAVLPQATGAGEMLISEFRFRGPQPAPSPPSSQNEFIELYNNTDSAVVVTTSDGSAGWAVATPSQGLPPSPAGARPNALTALTLFIIPNGTVIPARGHYLATQSLGFSLQAYPAGAETIGAGDIQYSFDVPDAEGIALFNTSNEANFNAATRLDAVGFAAAPLTNAPRVSDPLYAEGTPLPAAVTVANEHSFLRRLETGRPLDTDNNATDFVLVSTDPDALGGGSGAVLGAPGPESTQSPVQRNGLVKATLIDGGCYQTTDPTLACGRTRYTGDTVGPNRTLGTLRIRRRWTNNSEEFITRLRFRVVDVTTKGTPNGCGGCAQADLRALSAPDEAGLVVSGGGTADSFGLTLEEPPVQSLGGGLNSTLAAGTITPGTPLAPGDSINLTFSLGVEQAGLFRFFVNVEALTGPQPVFEEAGARPAAKVRQRRRGVRKY